MANTEKFLGALDIYYGDITDMEPGFLKAYGDVLPKIEQLLAGSK